MIDQIYRAAQLGYQFFNGKKIMGTYSNNYAEQLARSLTVVRDNLAPISETHSVCKTPEDPTPLFMRI